MTEIDEKEKNMDMPVEPAAAEITQESEERPDSGDHYREAKKTYSLCALILLVCLVLMNVVEVIALNVWNNLADGGKLPESIESQKVFLITLIGYMIAYPLTILLFRIVPREGLPQKKMSTGYLLSFFTICIPFMSVGNIIGSLLAGIFTAGQSSNAVQNILLNINPFLIVLVVTIAPVFEEYIFRKLLMDRLSGFDERAAIVFSALAFALYHTNIYQFFYTFGIGLVFAYVYSKSGKIRYSIILHMMFNILGSLIAPLALSQLNTEDLQKITDLASQNKDIPDSLIQSVVPGILCYAAYMLLFSALLISGIVFLIIRLRQLEFREPTRPLRGHNPAAAMLLNVGNIMYIAVSLALLVYMLITSTITA